ncbi:MAG: preprotein translocase subunit SecE [Actinomycetota bacterium]|jgi:preprotein translocase subunit SecE|nr:preprotein translocase subunit SecE [Actinomycetota bacterium]
MTKAHRAPKLNPLARMMRYFSDVRAEMRRVVWPTRTEVINSSLVVIVTLIVFITFIFAVDSASLGIVTWISTIGG